MQVTIFLKKASQCAHALSKGTPGGKLSDIAEGIAECCQDEKFCRIEKVNGTPMLFLCGKRHVFGIGIPEFLERIGHELDRYGQRAADAESNSGIDWKAISHAVRAIRECTQLLSEGRITFPLACRDEIRRIKAGQASWEETEAIILQGLAELEELKASSPCAAATDKAAAKKAVLACYGMGGMA